MSEKTPDDIFKLAKDEDVEYVDVRFCDLPGIMQHFTIPIYVLRRERVRGRPGLRRLVDSRVPVHPRVRHAAPSRSGDRDHRPVPRRQDAERELLRARPVHPRAVLARPAQRRPQGRELPDQHRHRRHRLLRRRGRVLHLRLGELRLAHQRLVLRGGRDLRVVEHRRADRVRRQPQPRLQGPPQGRLFPGRPHRPLRRPARQDAHQPDQRRLLPGEGPPRGGHRRPGRDQLQVQHAAARGRRHADVQVHRQATPRGRPARP